MKRRVKLLAIGTLACAGCCAAPFVAPAILGAAGSSALGSFLGGLDWAEIACVAGLAGLAAATLVLTLRPRRVAPFCAIDAHDRKTPPAGSTPKRP